MDTISANYNYFLDTKHIFLVGTESIEANSTLPIQQPSDQLSPAPGGINTNSQMISTAPVDMKIKKMWQCKQDVQNNSDKSVIGNYLKYRISKEMKWNYI